MYRDSTNNGYRVIYIEDNKKKSKFFRNKEDAENFEKTLTEEQKLNKKRGRKKQNKLLVSNIVKEYLLFLNNDRLKESTNIRYQQIANNAITKTGLENKQIDHLTSDDFNNALHQLAANGYSESVIKKVRRFYINLYDYALMKYSSKKGIRFSHISIKKLLKMPSSNDIKSEKEIYYLDENEYNVFIKYCCKNSLNERIYRFNYLYLLMLYTGIRVGELLALRWNDIDFRNNQCSITKSLTSHKSVTTGDYEVVDTKNRKNRIITLNSEALQTLKGWKTSQKKKNDFFENGLICIYDNRNISQNMLYKDLALITQKLKIEKNITPHSLRHTFATAYIAGYNNTQPGDIEKLSRYLGHSSVEVTRAKYVHAPEVCTL